MVICICNFNKNGEENYHLNRRGTSIFGSYEINKPWVKKISYFVQIIYY